MALEVVVPRLGWTMEEGVFGGWLKNDGDAVEEGDPIFTLESDKGAQDVEAIEGGVLRIAPSGPASGEVVKVGALLGYILQPGEAVSTQTQPPAQAQPPSPPAGQKETRVAESPQPPQPIAPAAPAAPGERKIVPPISPRAARLAGQLGMDWTQLRGSGRGGRIVERDVRRAATPD